MPAFVENLLAKREIDTSHATVLLRARLGVDEVVTTLMLNFIAVEFGPFRVLSASSTIGRV
jgi:hypothetical protein